MTSVGHRVFYWIGFPAGHAAVDAGTAALWIIAPAIAAGMGLSSTQVGLIFTAGSIAAGVTHIPASLVGETRFRGVFLLSTFWWVAGAYVAASLMQSYWALLVFIALAASGAAAWHPVAMGALAERMPGRRALALGVHYAGGSLVEVLAPIVAGLLLAVMDWRSVMQFTVAPALIMGGLFLRLHHRIRPPVMGSLSPRDLRDEARLIRRPASLAALGILGLYSMALMGMWSMTPLYLVEVRELSSGAAGALFSAMVLAGSLGAVLLGRLADTRNRKTVTLAVLGTGVASPLLILWVPTLPLLVVALMLAGVAIMGLTPALIAMVLSIVGGRQMVMIGLIMGADEIVGALGAVVAGLAGEIDLRLSLVVVAAITLASALLASMHPFASAVPQPEAAETLWRDGA
jgi:MFS transporter, FSR family, fosmidomycin resistance protein